ncbi:RHS repeat-associated core domain-containing protein [Serratia quinivorans]|uniref:RHS repeat-associated core domain-containing protein n=1 Tax=Serratia quinivorans TaxID=137545 RepID=UPI0021BA6C9D|nr:RHS repeat-associated core domain-containing protein [Serratia quinivorans]
MKNSITRVHSKTPQVAVLDNRGLSVRDIAYCRHPDSHQSTDERITHHQYNARSALTHSADPRQHKAGRANCIYVTNLAGQILRAQSVDSGTTVALNDAATRPFMTVTNIGSGKGGQDDASQAVTRIIQYEDRLLPGRPLSITEQVSGEVTRVTERFVYAGQTQQEKDLNLAGQCFRHYDTTGVVQMDSVALTGVTLSVTRRLLKDSDNVDAVTDWQGMDPAVWEQRLAPMAEARTTLSTADSTGAALTTVDAANNVQRVAYDVAGLLAGSWLTQKDGQEQSIVASLTYSAAGQKLRETHGNGVVTTYTYEPETQRLIGIKTERLSGHVSGARVLQDLRYEYDPVGNVLSIRNDAEETRFWHNQKVLPENKYVYDSLYQLVSANGREMASAGRQGNNLPTFVAFDNAAYTRYTRTYTYDTAGNLTQIRHNAPATNNNYTTDITLSARSNRGVPSTLTTNPEDVDALFTAGGQQKQLQPGQPLIWTARNELLKVTPVVRDGAADDSEYYRYDSSNQRVLKIGTQQTKAITTTQRVLYLPGLELRTTVSDGMVAQSLQVICIGEAGRAQVRVLHWESGKPSGFNQDQVRYSYNNLIGSCGLELDGDGNVISQEEYYPFGGTAILTARSQVEADYKTARYSGKERDATGLYYYGYRYYQPWAGRWLSADPAGTVDGLNLYRMVRNNPATFRDALGLNPINDNFSEKNGDLVYGLAAARGSYISDTINDRKFDPEDRKAPASIIDLYNNTVSGQIVETIELKTLQKFVASPKKRAKTLSPPSNIKELVKDSRNYPLWDDYFSIGERNAKFNIPSIYREVRKSPDSSQYHEWAITPMVIAPKLLWKRGSKLGIEIAASGAGNKIHFVLDDLEISSIVKKEGIGGQSITASELRYAYRNRERLVGKIHFYKDKVETISPWAADPELWESYIPKSVSGVVKEEHREQRGRIGSLFMSLASVFRKKAN